MFGDFIGGKEREREIGFVEPHEESHDAFIWLDPFAGCIVRVELGSETEGT